ncbi:MAG: flagellar export protein FliJ [Pseudomonadota bacterium]
MTKSQRLKPVARLAEYKERDAARLLAEAQHAVERHEERLNELLTYANEYRQRLRAAESAGMEAGQRHDYQVFIAKLDEAINQQRGRLAAATHELEHRRRQWLATHGASTSLDKIVARYADEETRSAARREQGEADERAQQLHTRKQGAGDL